jgi:aspartyl-tRNA(Asn)/glutamyl-tRNA(Gln) amidotransferase subunit C
MRISRGSFETCSTKARFTTFSLQRPYSTLEKFTGFGQPTWSVKSILDSENKEQISEEKIKSLAKLSLLKVEVTKIEPLKKEFSKMLAFVGTIQKVDTTNVEPLSTLLENESLMLREDKPNSNSQEEVLCNAKKTAQKFFVVPKGKEISES